MGEIDERDVGTGAWRETPEIVTETECPCAARGGHLQHLLGGEPGTGIVVSDTRNERGDPHRLEHVLVVRAAAAVRADADGNAGGQHRLRRCDAGAEPQVAARIVRYCTAVMSNALYVFVVEPDTVRTRKPLAQKADVVQMRSQGFTVSFET